jgi:hypothetical protein
MEFDRIEPLVVVRDGNTTVLVTYEIGGQKMTEKNMNDELM